MTNESIKYTFVCDPDNCDTLIEVTCASGFDYPNGVVELTCPCGRKMSYISATIQPLKINEKEDKMETTTQFLENQVQQLLQLRENHEVLIESLQKQITEMSAKLGSDHTNCDYWKKENGRIQSQIIDVVDEIVSGNWTDVNDIANTLCEIIDYEPKKEIEFTAVMHFHGRIEIDAREAEDFDLESALEDVYVDINNGDVVIDGYELYNADEC